MDERRIMKGVFQPSSTEREDYVRDSQGGIMSG